MIRKVAIAFIALFLFTRCIDENSSLCLVPFPERSVEVQITYTERTTDASKGIVPAEVSRLNLFVFDEQNKFVGEWIDEAPVLGPDYYMTLPLAPGNYRFITWGNLRDCYSVTPQLFVKGQTTLDEAILHLQHDQNNQITTAPHPLFFGNLLNVTVLDIEEQVFLLPIIQHTNRVNITVRGLIPNNNTYSLTISDSNGNLKFDNSFAPCPELHYTSTTTFDAQSELKASLTVLRLAEGRSPMLKSVNETEDKNLFNYELIPLIKAAISQGASIDFDETSEYNIIIYYQQGVIASISVNGWTVIRSTGGV